MGSMGSWLGVPPPFVIFTMLQIVRRFGSVEVAVEGRVQGRNLEAMEAAVVVAAVVKGVVKVTVQIQKD